MTSIGETLRRERMRRNLDLKQISRELKISSRMLEAIEEERFDRLPGGVFAKSFVRQYAHLLGLDEEDLAGQVQRMLDPQPVPGSPNGHDKRPAISIIHVPRVEEWEPAGGRRLNWGSWLPSLVMVVVVMLLCSGVYSWWQHSRRPAAVRAGTPAATETASAPAPIPAEPAAIQPVAAAQLSAPASANPQPQPSAPATANSANRPAADPTSTAARSAPAPADQPPPIQSAPAQPSATAAPASNPNAAVRVELTAEEPVWVRASTDGKFSFSGTLGANESRTIEANDKITLRIGNAGGVNVVLNGKPIGSVGPKGQVREVQFTSGGFQIVAAPPKPLVDPLL